MRTLTRTLLATPVALLMATSLSAQYPAPAATQRAADPDRMVATSPLPEGWTGRTDRGQPIAGAKFVSMAPGYHATTGPAAIFYRAADRVSGSFHTLATFHQTKAPAHPEAFGMFVGGNALDGEGQSYFYILVRGDGAFTIKRRQGAQATTLVPWTVNPVVVKADSAGQSSNKIEAQYIGGKLEFLINGTKVHSQDATPAEAHGIIGVRINHNLDVHVEGFEVHRIQ
jgi:hypothetical protein